MHRVMGQYSSVSMKAHVAIIFLMMCFIVSSSLSSIVVFDLVNKGVMAVLCLLILIVFCMDKQPHYSVLILCITGVLHAISFAYPVSSKEGIATYFLYAFWILFWLYVVCNRQSFIKSLKVCERGILSTITLWSIVTAGSLFIPSCYKLGWGGERYFVSFTTDSFEIAPIALFMLSLNILLYRFDGNKKRAIVLSLVPLACVFAAGTRTYFFVVLVEFAILLRLLIDRNGQFYLALACSVFVFVAIASISSIGQKFASAMIESSDLEVVLEVFTNGRSEFWGIDLRAFSEGTLFEILFGHGFSYVYELNELAIGMRLYAHNDFINILLNFGVVGLVVYFAAIIPMLREMTHACVPIIVALFAVVWLFNAFFNMIYVYAAAVLALGLLAIALLPEKGVDSLPNDAEKEVR